MGLMRAYWACWAPPFRKRHVARDGLPELPNEDCYDGVRCTAQVRGRQGGRAANSRQWCCMTVSCVSSPVQWQHEARSSTIAGFGERPRVPSGERGVGRFWLQSCHHGGDDGGGGGGRGKQRRRGSGKARQGKESPVRTFLPICR